MLVSPELASEVSLALASDELESASSLASVEGGSEAQANREVTKRMLENRRTRFLYENENGFQN